MYIMSADSCKKIDKYAIEQFKIPSIVLMENASNEIFLRIKDNYSKFLIVCGTGNNGGDALAIARKLILYKKEVKIIIIDPNNKHSEDFNVNLNIIKNLTSSIYIIKDIIDFKKVSSIIEKTEVIVDGIFGVGINRPLTEIYCKLIDFINLSNKDIISIDVPSGLDCDTGLPLGNSIKATITYTLEIIKKGFINYSSIEYLGELQVIPIGIPNYIKEKFNEEFYSLEDNHYKKLIIKRSIYGHKGNYGKCCLFAGSLGFSGAAYICTEACVKSGSGLITLITTLECQKIVSSQLIEAMTINYTEKERILNTINNSNVIAFGPGIRSGKEEEELLLWISENTNTTIIIDAEGINILSRRPDILDKVKGRCILTPHLGEMSRLTNKSIKEIESNRVEIAKSYAKDNNCIVLLKGYKTVITDGNKVFINNTGSSKMATGGMGDCLTGIITSLVGQGHNKLDSVILAAYIHGKCGDIAAKDKYSVLATDVIKKIPNIMNKLMLNDE